MGNIYVDGFMRVEDNGCNGVYSKGIKNDKGLGTYGREDTYSWTVLNVV